MDWSYLLLIASNQFLKNYKYLNKVSIYRYS
jgi:hypothetical protein